MKIKTLRRIPIFFSWFFFFLSYTSQGDLPKHLPKVGMEVELQKFRIKLDETRGGQWGHYGNVFAVSGPLEEDDKDFDIVEGQPDDENDFPYKYAFKATFDNCKTKRGIYTCAPELVFQPVLLEKLAKVYYAVQCFIQKAPNENESKIMSQFITEYNSCIDKEGRLTKKSYWKLTIASKLTHPDALEKDDIPKKIKVSMEGVKRPSDINRKKQELKEWNNNRNANHLQITKANTGVLYTWQHNLNIPLQNLRKDRGLLALFDETLNHKEPKKTWEIAQKIASAVIQKKKGDIISDLGIDENKLQMFEGLLVYLLGVTGQGYPSKNSWSILGKTPRHSVISRFFSDSDQKK